MRLQSSEPGRCVQQRWPLQHLLYVWDERSAFLIDCGTSLMTTIRKLGIDPNAVRAILITHLHGDHFCGLPFLILGAYAA